MTTLLSLETSFGKFSVTLFKDGKVLEHYDCQKENEQAELLLPAIETILENHNFTYNDLDYIAVGTGPGSFTGLRIGMAAAKGLALACRAKLIGVTSLEASAMKSGDREIYLNANRGEAYYQKFSAGLEPVSEAELITYSGEFSPLPDSAAVGQVALQKLKTLQEQGDNHFPPSVEPQYVRKPDAKLPK